MIKGTKRKLVPFFNKGNSGYMDYDEHSLVSFCTKPSVYFLDRDEGFFFDIESYYDIIVAPFFVSNKKMDTKYPYSKKLTKLFYSLFPKSKEYNKSLESEFLNVSEYLVSLLNQSEKKDTILESIASEQKKIHELLLLIRPLQKKYPYNEYLSTSILFAEKIKEQIETLFEKILLTSSKIILYDYYLGKYSISWDENPLAFFINILYGNGLDEILEERENDLSQYGDVESKENYIDKRFRREFAISLRLIKRNVKLKHLKKKKQEYIAQLCYHLTILFKKSISHPISEIYNDHLRPFKALVRNLKKNFPKFTFTVDFNFDVEEEELFIGKSEFLKNLFSVTINDVEKENRKLLKYSISNTNFRLFLVGDLENIPDIHFNWPKETIYYLLKKLLDNGATFYIKDLETKNKVRLCDDSSFVAGNYYKYKNLFKKGEKSETLGSDIIDNLFR